jgi:hypothetical protein
MISLPRLLTVLALSTSPASADALDDGDIDSGDLDPHAAAHLIGGSLANVLAEMRPLAATHLATTWAASEDPVRREAVAHALELVFPLFGDRAILAHLAHDPDPGVREASKRASRVRL